MDNNNKKQPKIKLKTKKIITKKIYKKKNIFYKAVSFVFNEIAKKNKLPKNNAEKAVDEYFNLLTNIKKKPHSILSKMSGGAPPMLSSFVSWIRTGITFGIHSAIGTFDTPCNIIISFIAVGTWCVVVYNTINNISPEEARHSLAQPVQYVIYNNMPDAYYIEEKITNVMIDYVETNVKPQIPLLSGNVSTIIDLLRTLFWESTLYNIFIIKQISCLLLPIVSSCDKNCPIIKSKSSKSKSSKSKSSKSKSSRSKSSRSKSSRSKSKSIYLTPPEKM